MYEAEKMAHGRTREILEMIEKENQELKKQVEKLKKSALRFSDAGTIYKHAQQKA